jgi:hypothetical protein
MPKVPIRVIGEWRLDAKGPIRVIEECRGESQRTN